ncbi:MAG: DNA polymerase III subunit alpha [Bacilli bacterium]
MIYIPLNIKTSYSLLSSLNDIKLLIKKAKEYNFPALGITDSNMFGVMEFYKECQKAKIKPIIGLELKINNLPILLYAFNYQGYQHLTKLLSISQEEEITIEILKKYQENIFCLLPYNSIKLYEEIKDIYSFFYLSYSNLEERDKLKGFNSKLVFSQEVLYLEKEDNIYLKYLYMIKDGQKETEIDNYQIPFFHYLKTKEEVLKVSVEEDLKVMEEIYNLSNLVFPSNQNLLPKYQHEGGYKSEDLLRSLCKKGLEKRLSFKISSFYIERLKYELSIIHKMGFEDYFLVVWDYVKYAKQNNILVGPGRGSAAGSLVAYCLGITDVDPIKYNLLFERFLNPERISMPDIDLDFEATRREEVVNYILHKYGLKKAMPIITFVTLRGRQVIRDVGRILEINLPVIDELCHLIKPNISLEENLKNYKIKELLNQDKSYLKMYKIASKLEGMKRQISLHAAGVVISSEYLDEYIPIKKYNNFYVTGYSMEHLEELGLLKMDVLALKNLTLMENVLINTKININDIPMDDIKTLSLFKEGLTEGIFQFESAGMKRFIKELKPDNFEEIIAAIALFRPGPMENIEHFIKRKYGKEKIDYFHPHLKDILKPTYGIIVYQEQIMQIANVLAGYSLGEADILRKAMGKKDKGILLKEQEKFINQSIKRGYEKGLVIRVFNLILKFAGYGFNRAHSVAYSMISYKMAYLKKHYAKYFMSALLTNVLGNENKTKEYINECKILTIPILKPDINLSDYPYLTTELGIRFSLGAIKNVGGVVSKAIITERKKGLYEDFFDFVVRLYGKAVNRKILEALIDASCFNSFGYNHQTLHYNLEKAINYAELVNQINETLALKPEMEIKKEFSKEEKSKRELKVFGFYLTNHPVTKYKNVFNHLITINDIKKHFDKTIYLLLYIERYKIVITKNQERMAFITGSDEFGIIDLILFPKTLEKYSFLEKGDVIKVKGRVEKRMSKYQIIGQEVEKLS